MTILYRLVKLLSRMETLLSNIHSSIQQYNQMERIPVKNPPDVYLHPAEVMQLLKISASTLYRLKKSGVLVPTALNGKLYRHADLDTYRRLYD